MAECSKLPWRMENCRLMVGLLIAESVETGGRVRGVIGVSHDKVHLYQICSLSLLLGYLLSHLIAGSVELAIKSFGIHYTKPRENYSIKRRGLSDAAAILTSIKGAQLHGRAIFTSMALCYIKYSTRLKPSEMFSQCLLL